MCGRFTLTASLPQIEEAFTFVRSVTQFEPQYNIAPSQMILCIRQLEQQSPEFVLLRWGLIPPWMEEEKISSQFINARAETVESKPLFKRAFQFQRCIIIADGFFEWQKNPKKKQPFYIYLKNHTVFGIAGIWSSWQNNDRRIESCAIIVTEANPEIAPIHDRMPVILDPSHFKDWLDPKQNNIKELKGYLKPFSKLQIQHHPVSFKVNNPWYDLSDTIEPIAT